MKPDKGKNWPAVMEYAESIRDGKKVACLELRQAVERFFRDLESPDYELDAKGPEFCICLLYTSLMEIEKLIAAIKLCGSTPRADQCKQ